MSNESTIAPERLPANIEAERYVLASCLRDSDVFESLAALLNPGLFSIPAHATIIEVFTHLYTTGMRIDRVTVANELRRRKLLDQVGGITALCELEDGFPRLANIESYVEILQRKALLRSAIVESLEFARHCLDDSDENSGYLARAERLVNLVSSSNASAVDMPYTVGQIVEEEGGLDSFFAPDNTMGIELPITVLNATFDGLRRAKLYLWAARPGDGKTALLQQCAEATAKQGFRALVISKEMKRRDLVKRSAAGKADVSSYTIRRGKMSNADRSRIHSVMSEMIGYDHNLLIYDRTDCTTQHIRYILRRLRAMGQPVHALFVDYVQLIDSAGNARSRRDEVSKVSTDFVKIKNEFDIPVILLAQLSREGDSKGKRAKDDDGEPFETQIAESDQLNRDADSILLLWRSRGEQEKQLRNPSAEVVMNWKVTKNRDGIKNRGGRNADGLDDQGLIFLEKQARFREDRPVRNYSQEAA